MEGNYQVNDVVYKSDVLLRTRVLLKKVYLGLAERENERPTSITKSYHWNTKDTKAILSSYMWHLKSVSSETLNFMWPALIAYHHTQISRRNTSCGYMKNI